MITREAPLHALQEHVALTEIKRGFHAQSTTEKCLLLGEEIGELFKAVRKTSGLAVDPESEVKDVAYELADILNYPLAIANRYQIDLGEAFVAKEQLNGARTWLPSPTPTPTPTSG
ncbi:MazG nucleotide pyrophosphohydrolase domain-containing protein [Lysobacter sp. CCNWLW3]|uniref:MazG nucleotide pyrophosphohydrolase domain-containing protein n=1 Tax=unclassified Lysobacter TaxID=2635362 RepID=UPI002FCEB8F5